MDTWGAWEYNLTPLVRWAQVLSNGKTISDSDSVIATLTKEEGVNVTGAYDNDADPDNSSSVGCQPLASATAGV